MWGGEVRFSLINTSCDAILPELRHLLLFSVWYIVIMTFSDSEIFINQAIMKTCLFKYT